MNKDMESPQAINAHSNDADGLNRFSLAGRFKALVNSTEKPTQQGIAIECTRMGLKVFPCNSNKTPVKDSELGFIHGFLDATSDPKLIAKAWHRYPDAGIGLALPEDLQVFDCDIARDAGKTPALKDRKPDMVGLKSFQRLAVELCLSDSDLDTLTVATQSGGRHFYFRMPKGVVSFNHTRAMEGLDLKGFGGYVLLPNSRGKNGNYSFLNLAEIREISGALLKWMQQFKFRESAGKEILATGHSYSMPRKDASRETIEKSAAELTDLWARADGRHHELTLAITGYLEKAGWPAEDIEELIRILVKATGKGFGHLSQVRRTYGQTSKKGHKWGLPKMIEIGEAASNGHE